MIDNYILEANQLAQEITKEKALLHLKEERLKKIIDTYCLAKCESCGTIVCRENLAAGTYTTTSTETVYQDCGYGDDDEIAEVTYLHHVKRCPKCGYAIENRKEKVSESNRRARNQNLFGPNH